MSVIQTPIVFKCSHCHENAVINGIATTKPDESLELIHQLVEALTLNGLCPKCQALYNYGAEQERRGYGKFEVKVIAAIEPGEKAPRR
jgi:Zn finger protein HypA/HybF involved in hydrogenase expression